MLTGQYICGPDEAAQRSLLEDILSYKLLLLLRVDADQHGAMLPACLSRQVATDAAVEEFVRVVIELLPFFRPCQVC